MGQVLFNVLLLHHSTKHNVRNEQLKKKTLLYGKKEKEKNESWAFDQFILVWLRLDPRFVGCVKIKHA